MKKVRRTQVFDESSAHSPRVPSQWASNYDIWVKQKEVTDETVGKAISEYMTFVGEEMKTATFFRITC